MSRSGFTSAPLSVFDVQGCCCPLEASWRALSFVAVVAVRTASLLAESREALSFGLRTLAAPGSARTSTPVSG